LDTPAARVVALNCPGCGAALEVGPALTQLACGYCGKSAMVDRSGGTVALLPMVAAIERVQAATDKTAAELALVRLRAEQVTLQQSYRGEQERHAAEARKTTTGAAGLSVVLAFVAALALWIAVAATDEVRAWAILILSGSLGGLALAVWLASRSKVERDRRHAEAIAPLRARMDWVEEHIVKNEATVTPGGAPIETNKVDGLPIFSSFSTDTKTEGGSGRRAVGIGCLICLVLVIVLTTISSLTKRPSQPPPLTLPTEAVAEPATRINYTVARQWVIPNGGFGRAIVISTSDATDARLRELGMTLKYDTRRDRNAFVFVFDDSVAAAMQARAGDLGKKDGRFYDRHHVAQYDRNINTGFHQLAILNKKDGTALSLIQY